MGLINTALRLQKTHRQNKSIRKLHFRLNDQQAPGTLSLNCRLMILQGDAQAIRRRTSRAELQKRGKKILRKHRTLMWP